MLRWSCAGIVIVVVAGCGDAGGIGGRPSSGDFGQITATPECGALSQACIGQGLNAPLARGSHVDLDVEYRVAGSSGPPTVLASANEAAVVTDTTSLEAIDDGMSAVMFIGPDESVIDIIHVWVQTPTELRINRYAETGELLGEVQPSSQLLVGDEILVATEPYGNGQFLLGNFDLTYGSSSDAVAIVPDPVGGWYRVVARSPGLATVTFRGLDVVATWELEVLP